MDIHNADVDSNSFPDDSAAGQISNGNGLPWVICKDKRMSVDLANHLHVDVLFRFHVNLADNINALSDLSVHILEEHHIVLAKILYRVEFRGVL